MTTSKIFYLTSMIQCILIDGYAGLAGEPAMVPGLDLLVTTRKLKEQDNGTQTVSDGCIQQTRFDQGNRDSPINYSYN